MGPNAPPARTQRLAGLVAHLAPPPPPAAGAEAAPAAGLRQWLVRLFGGGAVADDSSFRLPRVGWVDDSIPSEDAQLQDVVQGAVPAVRGVVRACFVAPDESELAATYEGGVSHWR
jgi:hypothetical protein